LYKKVFKSKENLPVFLILIVVASSLCNHLLYREKKTFLDCNVSLKRAENGVCLIDRAICKGVENGKPVDVTEKFLSDETVFCWVKMIDNIEKDKI